MKEIKVAMMGIDGQMGRIIVECSMDDECIKVVAGCEKKGHPLNNKSIYGGRIKVMENNPDNLIFLKEAVDALIDFSDPDATLETAGFWSGTRKPMVIGTTGLDKHSLHALDALSNNMPIVLAPNMSSGVNLLFGLLPKLVKALGLGFDIEISEIHHKKKKDAPSGTAKKMAEIIAEARGMNIDNVVTYGRHGLIGERPKDEIGISSLRLGDVVGEHTIMFGGLGERIEITHKATSKDTFAMGALKAAKWIVGKEPGLYSMMDVLGLND